MFIYAHRGSSEAHPENTVEAFRSALEEGADGIETDLRLTSDGVIVLAHDARVRGTDGVKRAIELERFETLRAASPSGGRGLPTLEELVEVADGKAGVNLEIKDPAVVPLLGPFLARIPGALITSFDFDAVKEAHRLYPEVPAGMVVERWNGAREREAFTEGFSALSLKGSHFRPEILAGCRDRGMKLNIWVVNEPSDARRALAAGVDGIFTDRPGEIRRALFAP